MGGGSGARTTGRVEASSLRGQDPKREPVPIAGGVRQRWRRMHGDAEGSGAPMGNRNAQKHGLYGRELGEFRGAVRELLRAVAKLHRTK
jgi:hypothetical protein